MKRVTLGLLILLSIASCHQVTKPEKPQNLISKDKMVNILIDMSLLVSSRGVDKNVLEKNNVSVQSFIYDKYGVDSTQLAKSNDYYAYDIEGYESIYVKVTDSLSALSKKYEKERDEEEDRKRKKDSLEKETKHGLTPIKSKNPKKIIGDSLKLPKMMSKE